MKKNLHGTVVAIDERTEKYVRYRIENNVLPPCQTLIEQYATLELSKPMDLELIDVLMTKGVIVLQNDLHDQTETRYSNLPFELKDHALTTINVKLKPLQESINRMNFEIRNLLLSNLSNGYHFEINDLVILDGIVSISETFKAKFETVIESDEQQEIYNEFVAFEKQYNRLAACLEKLGETTSNTDYILQYFKMQENKRLKFDATVISNFNKHYA